eukprot:m.92099 g.92099  ORF g.92099 m.92099 type:complete len:406 (-) comp13337_c0_seq2:909-2126(-)
MMEETSENELADNEITESTEELETSTEAPPSRISATQRCLKFTKKNLLPILLLSAVALGLIWPAPGVAVGTKVNGQRPVQLICVIIIFLISGLNLSTAEMFRAIQEYKGIIWGLLSILFVTACVGVNIVQEIDMESEEFTKGLAVFFTMPTTISSGVVLTQQMNGNFALALFLTVVTNTIGVFTVPPMLGWLIEFESEVSLDIGGLVAKLSLTVLLPLAVGKVLQKVSTIAAFTKRHKWHLKVVSMVSLAFVPWMNTSVAMDNGNFDSVTAGSVFSLIGLGMLLHVIFLFMNSIATTLLRISRPEQAAVVIVSSQKTLPVSLTVIGFLPESAGDHGLMGVACIVAHLTQIIVDSVIIGFIPANFIPTESKPEYSEIKEQDVKGNDDDDVKPLAIRKDSQMKLAVV